jgi:general secretion pathway protein A
MYEAFYGLAEAPFELTANPKFLLLTSRHREALSNVRYGMTGRKGLTLLLGDAGTGKTTVVRAALDGWQSTGVLVAYVNNPLLSRAEFLEYLADGFGLSAAAGNSKSRFLSELTEKVLQRHSEGLVTGLLVDEAQALSNDLLEEIRLLANIDTPTEKVFPVVLVGQPELAERLNQPTLRQIKQRISLRCSLGPLDARETAGYITGRIQIAGGSSMHLFTREALRAIYEGSRGIPRLINVICDNVLLAGFAANRKPITHDLVQEICRDFDLLPDASSTPAAPKPSLIGTPVPAPATPAAPQPPQAANAPDATAPSVPARKDGATGTLFGHFTSKRRFSFF